METDLFLRPLFDWRGAISSPFGPKSYITRHVLMVLALHMSTAGDSCFPTIEVLTQETGLCKATVITHLKIASETGWLGKQMQKHSKGQGWRRIEYFALIPEGVAEQVMQWRGDKKQRFKKVVYGVDQLKGGLSGDEGGLSDNTPNIKVLNKNLLGEKAARYTPEFDQTFKSYPQRAGNNPKHDAWKAYNARLKEGVMDAQLLAGVQRYAAWCTATGKIGSEYVMRASTFFGAGRAFEQAFPITDDVTKGPKAEPRCIHIPEGQGASQRCMDAGDVGVGVIEIAGQRVAIRLCHRHYLPPIAGASGLVTNPAITEAVKRFTLFANDRLVPA